MKYNTLIPELTVKNIERTKSFYVDIQGFDIEFERAEDKFVFLSFRDAQMMFEQFHDSGWTIAPLEYPFGRGINFEIGVDNLDLLYERVLLTCDDNNFGSIRVIEKNGGVSLLWLFSIFLAILL